MLQKPFSVTWMPHVNPYFFWFLFFCLVFWCDWRASYTSAIKSRSNLKRSNLVFDVCVSFTSKAKILSWPFFVWRVNTRQWYAFLFTDVFLHVTERISSTDVYGTRQCMPHAKKWCLTCDLHVSARFSFPLTWSSHVTEANFFYWRVHHTSVASKRIDFAETVA